MYIFQLRNNKLSFETFFKYFLSFFGLLISRCLIAFCISLINSVDAVDVVEDPVDLYAPGIDPVESLQLPLKSGNLVE